jgi:starvation-inducible DNA-binding protein
MGSIAAQRTCQPELNASVLARRLRLSNRSRWLSTREAPIVRRQKMTTMTAQPAPATAPVIDRLQRELGNAFVLFGNCKRYHWQVSGPQFRDLHLLFDELGDAAAASIDPIGERIRILGGDPVATPSEVHECASVAAATLGASVRSMIEQALDNESRVVEGIRDTIAHADETGDPGTSSLLGPLLETHEKHQWFLREILERDDLR